MFEVTDCNSCADSEGDLLGTENINIDSNVQKREMLAAWKILGSEFNNAPSVLGRWDKSCA